MTITLHKSGSSFILLAKEPVVAVDLALSYHLLKIGTPSVMRGWHSRAITQLRRPQVRSAAMALGEALDNRPLSSAVQIVASMTDGLLRYRSCCRGSGSSGMPGHSLSEYYRAVIKPYAIGLVAAVDFERSQFDRIIRTEGARALPHHLEGSSRTGLEWPFPAGPQNEDVTIVWSAFCRKPMVVTNPDHGHAIAVYPMSSVAQSIAMADPEASRIDRQKPLEDLLGRTRAIILHILQETHTTTRVAECSAVSVPTASRHLTILRDSGMVLSRRRANEVHHELTTLGETLLRSSTPSATHLHHCSCRYGRPSPWPEDARR